MPVNCVIVDDEPTALQLVESYVEKTAFLKLQSAFTDPIKALEFIKEHKPELVFLDINMPDLNGIDLSKLLPKQTQVVFTTAYDQYAVESYKLNALYYLLKPFNYAEFLEAASKAEHEHSAPQEEKIERAFIFIKADYKLHQIWFDEILFVENLKDYVRFWLKDGRKLMSLMSLKSLVNLLPGNFMRTHRSYIVNLDSIEMVERNRIVIKGEYIPVAEAYQEEFKTYLKSKTV